MDPTLPKSSPDKSDVRASFRRPSNDAANRKYRRHSPLGDSDSYSSGGSPKRERSHSPVHSKEDHSKRSDDQQRKDDGRELEKEYNCYRSTREHDSHRHSDRHTYGTSRDFHRHDHSRYRRHADEDERNYHRSSRSGRELRDDSFSDRVRRDRASDRSRDSWRDVGNHSRDKYENAEYRSKRKERETDAQEHNRYSDKDYDKAVSGSRQRNSGIDYGKSGERDRQKNREARDDKRDYHGSPGNYKNDRSSLHDDLREPGKDLASGRDSGCLRLKETHKSSNKEIDEQEDLVQKKHSNWESDRRKEKRMKEPEEERQNENRILSSYQERDGRYEQHLDKSSNVIDRQNSSATRLKLGNAVDEKPSSSLKQLEDMDEKVTSEPMGSFTIQAGGGSDLNAAKVAAMKAAELVNRNLVGGNGVGCLSTDQKKKLLWGNKKNDSSEETANRWDLNLFSDQERQEKFNKLMGVKGNVIPEDGSADKDVSLHAKKREELQVDLEKQYTAGLRRRDGRTVGLGL